LDVAVDQGEKVTNVSIKKGISKKCDAEAKRAFIDSTQKRYARKQAPKNIHAFICRSKCSADRKNKRTQQIDQINQTHVGKVQNYEHFVRFIP